MSKTKPKETKPKEKTFTVLIKNPNGATEGIGTIKLQARGVDRKQAQERALTYVRTRHGDHYRLHDTETEKPL